MAAGSSRHSIRKPPCPGGVPRETRTACPAVARSGTFSAERRKATAGRAFGPGTDPLRSPAPSGWRISDMKRILMGTAALVVLGAAPAAAQQSVKIGFVRTFSGPNAVIGKDIRNSFEVALEHLGRKMAGKPVEVIYEDDQQKPEVGVRKSQKLIESDKVDFVVGYIW